MDCTLLYNLVEDDSRFTICSNILKIIEIYPICLREELIMDKITVISAKLSEEVYKELILRVPEGDRSSFIRDAILEKLQKIPRPNKIFELEQKINKLEADLSEIKKYLVELEVLTYERGKINPHAFCIDNIDHKIVDNLLHYKGATTSELADIIKTNR